MRNGVGNRERVNLFFDEEILAGLRTLAKIKQTTFSELVRVACREYVATEAQKAIEQQGFINKLHPGTHQ